MVSGCGGSGSSSGSGSSDPNNSQASDSKLLAGVIKSQVVNTDQAVNTDITHTVTLNSNDLNANYLGFSETSIQPEVQQEVAQTFTIGTS